MSKELINFLRENDLNYQQLNNFDDEELVLVNCNLLYYVASFYARKLSKYKRDEQFSYVECWFEDDKIVKHYGLVGDKGDIKKYENCSIDDYKLYLDIFVGRYEKLGYISWREFTNKTLLMKITIEDNEQNLWKEENEAPIYFLYEMVQKALEINVVGFLNDWGYRRNEKKNLYEIDFYFDTVDKDIAVNLVKHVIEVFSMNAKSKVEEVIELAEVKNGVV